MRRPNILIPWRLRVAVAIAAALAYAAPAVAQNYTLTDLGVLSTVQMGGQTTTDDTDSHAVAINASGSVVGYSGEYTTGAGFVGQHAFLWTPDSANATTGTMRYLGGLPGVYCFSPEHTVGGLTTPAGYGLLPTVPSDINSAGQVVGSSNTSPDGTCPNTTVHAALWSNGSVTDLGIPPPGSAALSSISLATSINDAGKIVGDVQTGSTADGWLYDGSFHDLGYLPSTAFSPYILSFAVPSKINNSGTLVGTSYIPNLQGLLGFVHTGPGALQATDALGTLGGGTSAANSINAAGRIVGASAAAMGGVHAFWTNKSGQMVDLGTASQAPGSNSSALAINKANNIVGSSDIDLSAVWQSFETGKHAVMWQNGGNLIDLNSLLDPLLKPPFGTSTMFGATVACPHIKCWELLSATGINDLGQIVGEALVVNLGEGLMPDPNTGRIGERHAFLLTPGCITAGGDSDGDGLCDDWEKNGYTAPDGTFVNLPAMGADPMRKDIFVQADYMVGALFCGASGGLCTYHTHEPKPDAMALVTQAFANAPVSNPNDGPTGINIHIDCGADCIMNPQTGETWGSLSQAHAIQETFSNVILGDQLDASCVPTTPDSCAYNYSAFDQLKMSDFLPSRAPIFHYMVFAHDIGVYSSAGLAHIEGISEGIPASGFIVSLGGQTAQVGTTWNQAGTFMHELGHNLGLEHGGYDSVNYKPNYLSVMNYSFQEDGLINGGINGYFDYSRFPAIPDLDEHALNETVGLNGGAAIANYGTAWYCAGGGAFANDRRDIGTANGAIDWNCNGNSSQTSVAATINNDPSLALIVLHSSEDWNHLIYTGGGIGGLGVGASPPSPTFVPEGIVAPDPQAPFRVAIVGPGNAQAVAGTTFNDAFTINNTGLQSDTYNLSVTSLSNWWTTSAIPSTLTLAGGANQQLTVPVNVSGCITPGTTAQFTLKAVSQAHPSIADSVVVTLTVAPSLPGTVSIPNVVGLTQAAAQTAILTAGLTVGTVTTQSSTTVAAGSVISQSPACGVVAPGTAISLTVSTGPPPVAVPNLVGDSQLTAIFAIRGAGLTVGTITTAPSSTEPQGFVASQDPPAGTPVAPGFTVNFVVSSGTPVPNLVGQTEQAAVAALTAAGLTVGTLTPQLSSTVPEFIVISQFYPAGTLVNPGTAINIIFSSGSQHLVQVPDAQTGTAAFIAAGLTIGTITPVLSSTVRKEFVISQDPAVGTFAAVGTPVNVVLSAGPQLIPMPNVVGQWEWFALQNIFNNSDPSGLPAPLQATVSRQPSTTVPDGFVISQNPAAGAPAPMLSVVNLVVSSGGPVMTTVPNTIGDPSQYFNPAATQGRVGPAYAAIDAAGLALGRVTLQLSTTVPQGWIISQNPPAGTAVPWDTSVSLVVSEGGGATVPIPNLVGLTQAAAVTTLNNTVLPGIYFGDYLTYAFTTQSSATVPAGTVISQNPPAGQATLPIVGNRAIGPVSFVISAGPSSVPGYSYLGQFAGAGVNGVSSGKGRISPYSLAIDPVTRNIVADSGQGMIQILDANGNFKSYFGGIGLCCGEFNTYWLGVFPGDQTGDGLFVGAPTGIAIDPVNHHIVVADGNGERVVIFNSAGQFLSVFGSQGSGPGQFNLGSWGVISVAIDPTSENIIVSDPGNSRIQVFTSAGVYLSQFGTQGSGNGQFFFGPGAIAVDPVNHNIVAADSGNARVQIFNSAGVYQGQFGTYGQGDNQFGSIVGLTIDAATRNIIVADLGVGNENTNQPINRVRVFDATGHFLVKFGGPGSGDGQIGGYAVAVDPVTSNILVADGGNSRIAIFGAPSSAAATTTAVTSSANPATAGQSITFTATVTGNSPTGTVQFMDGAANLGTPVALTAGAATLTSSTLSAGTHPVTAVYSGDGSNAPSTSTALNEVIRAISTTTVTSPLNPATAGQAVTLTATVAGNSPTGTVQFMDGATNLGAPVALAAGTASLSSSTLSPGTHPITAVYSGDISNAPSTSAVLNQTVLAVSTTTVSSSLNPATAGLPVTLTATVAGNGPTGTVQFLDGSVNLGAVVPLAGGTASLTTGTLSVATHPITAVYSGDTSNAPSTSAVLNEVISAALPVVTPPANISVPATQAGGATGTDWPALAAFVAGGSVVDTADPSPIRLAPQVAGAPVNNATLFPVGTTTVTFLFQDHSGNVGSATATVTVTVGIPRITGSVAGIGVDSSGAIYADIRLTNTGTGNGRNLTLNTLVFRTLSGTGTVTYDAALSPPLPLAVGNLDLGAPVTTRLYLNVPSTVLRLSVTESGPVQDVSGNNYNYSTAESFVP